MRSLISRRMGQRGQQGMAMMAGMVIYVGLSGVALIALLNMSFTSLRIAGGQETTAQELRAVDSALSSAVNELRADQSHATATPNGDGTCARSLGRLDQPGLVYDDGLGNRVVVLTRCSAAVDRPGVSQVSLTAMLGAQGEERPGGTARLAVRPTSSGQLVVVEDWSLRPDPAEAPVPPDTTTTTTAAPTTVPSSTTAPTTTVPTTAEWALTVTSDWTDGYCVDVRVTNPTDERLDWVVTVPVEGTIYVFWSGEHTRSGDRITVKGLDWNRTLEPGAGTNFGFCANR